MQIATTILTALLTVAAIYAFKWLFKPVDEGTLRQQQPQQLGLDFIPSWSADESRILRGFLDSETGRNFMRRARGVERETALKMCGDVMHTSHSAGRAAGFSDCLTWIQSLASDDTINKLSGASAVQDAKYSTALPQDEVTPVALRRSF